MEDMVGDRRARDVVREVRAAAREVRVDKPDVDLDRVAILGTVGAVDVVDSDHVSNVTRCLLLPWSREVVLLLCFFPSYSY